MSLTLTNYWWLLIWLIIGGVILSYAVPKEKQIVNGSVTEQWHWVPAIALVLPFVIWTGFRSDNFGDTGAYRAFFQTAPVSFSEIPEFISTVTKDKGFYSLVCIIKTIIGEHDVLFFLMLGAFQILIVAWLYRKYSCDYWLSIFLFVISTDYLSWTQNGIRQFTAVTIVLLATPFMINKKYLRASLLILLAATMHQSALLVLVLMIIAQGKAWNAKTLLFLMGTILAVVFVNRFTHILDTAMQETQYANMVTDWTEWEDNGTNPIRVLFYSMPTIMSLVGWRYVKAEDDPVIDFCINMSICSTGFYLVSMVTSGIFIGRLPIYASLYNYILLPWEVEHYFTLQSAKLVKATLICVYIVFFYYQMHFAWGLM